MGVQAVAAWITPGIGLFLGQSGNNQGHRHMAMQLAIGLDEPVRVVCPGGELRAPAVAIRAGQEHRIEVSRLLSIYLDPFCAEARALRLSEPLQPLMLGDSVALLNALQQVEVPAAELRQALSRYLQLPPAAPLDPRLVRLLPLLEDPDRDLQQLAQQVYLSPSRFSRWFKVSSGLQLRSYRKWHRLIRALQAISDGHNLTTATHFAGFADAAHFSRSFRSLLGLDPSPGAAAGMTASWGRHAHQFLQVASDSRWAPADSVCAAHPTGRRCARRTAVYASGPA